MSGFEHYSAELASVDHEIAHWAVVCGIEPHDRRRLEAVQRGDSIETLPSQAKETLRGLLMLRLKLETEMLEIGIVPNPLEVLPNEQGAP